MTSFITPVWADIGIELYGVGRDFFTPVFGFLQILET